MGWRENSYIESNKFPRVAFFIPHKLEKVITFVAASSFANSRDGTPNQMYKTKIQGTKLKHVNLFYW